MKYVLLCLVVVISMNILLCLRCKVFVAGCTKSSINSLIVTTFYPSHNLSLWSKCADYYWKHYSRNVKWWVVSSYYINNVNVNPVKWWYGILVGSQKDYEGIRIYNRTLTTIERTMIYNEGN